MCIPGRIGIVSKGPSFMSFVEKSCYRGALESLWTLDLSSLKGINAKLVRILLFL